MNTKQKTSGEIEFTLGNSKAPLPGTRSKDLIPTRENGKDTNPNEAEKKKVGTMNAPARKKVNH